MRHKLENALVKSNERNCSFICMCVGWADKCISEANTIQMENKPTRGASKRNEGLVWSPVLFVYYNTDKAKIVYLLQRIASCHVSKELIASFV